MSGFWTLKIGKNKQAEKKSVKKNGNNGFSGKGSLNSVRSLIGRTPAETEPQVDSVQTIELREAEMTFPDAGHDAGYQPETGKDSLEKVKPEKLKDIPVEFPEHPDAKNNSDNEPFPASIVIDKQTMYSENVELAVNIPIEPAALSRFYNNLEMTPEIKVLYTSGSWERGTIITVSLEKPIPLLEIITNIQGLDVSVLEPQQRDNSKRSTVNLLGNNKKKITRIDLFLKTK